MQYIVLTKSRYNPLIHTIFTQLPLIYRYWRESLEITRPVPMTRPISVSLSIAVTYRAPGLKDPIPVLQASSRGRNQLTNG